MTDVLPVSNELEGQGDCVEERRKEHASVKWRAYMSMQLQTKQGPAWVSSPALVSVQSLPWQNAVSCHIEKRVGNGKPLALAEWSKSERDLRMVEAQPALLILTGHDGYSEEKKKAS